MFVEINGKQIHYHQSGKGTPILFVHGWGGTISSLQKLHELSSKKFDSIIIDLPGFGKSDPPNADWGVEEYGAILIELIYKFRLVKPAYFGHSFGGSLGIFLSAKYPDLIDRLILCNSAYRRDKATSQSAKNMDKNVLSKMPLYHIWKAPIKKFIYSIFFRSSDLYKFPHLETNFRKIVTQDLTPYISQIKVPTLILWGDHDTYTPVEYAYELQKAIPQAKMMIYPGKRHNLPLLYPNEVFNELSSFLS